MGVEDRKKTESSLNKEKWSSLHKKTNAEKNFYNFTHFLGQIVKPWS